MRKTITEVSQEFGVSANGIRYYEQAGVIPPIPKGRNGNRYFDELACYWLEQAVCLRNSGIPIQVLARYVDLAQVGRVTRPERLALLKEQRQELERQKQCIEQSLERLAYKIDLYEGRVADADCILKKYEP